MLELLWMLGSEPVGGAVELCATASLDLGCMAGTTSAASSKYSPGRR